MPRLIFISDTHTQQGQKTQQVIAARADVLVHCGDFCNTGERLSEVGDFADWCTMLMKKGYVKYVVLVAGNHDQPLDSTCKFVQGGRQELPAMARERLRRAGIAYLDEESAIVAGLTFYGIPWVNRCGEWAFMIDDPGQDERIFNKVREGIDVLVTHSPPFGVLDEVAWPGSKGLLRAIERARPRVHVFGHNHRHRSGRHIMKAALVSIIAALLCVDAIAVYEVQCWVADQRSAAFADGMHFGSDSASRQYQMMPDCNMRTCDSIIEGLQREDEDWVDYMLESCELDNVECQTLGGCEPVVRDLSPWQDRWVRTHEVTMQAHGGL